MRQQCSDNGGQLRKFVVEVKVYEPAEVGGNSPCHCSHSHGSHRWYTSCLLIIAAPHMTQSKSRIQSWADFLFFGGFFLAAAVERKNFSVHPQGEGHHGLQSRPPRLPQQLNSIVAEWERASHVEPPDSDKRRINWRFIQNDLHLWNNLKLEGNSHSERKLIHSSNLKVHQHRDSHFSKTLTNCRVFITFFCRTEKLHNNWLGSKPSPYT